MKDPGVILSVRATFTYFEQDSGLDHAGLGFNPLRVRPHAPSVQSDC